MNSALVLKNFAVSIKEKEILKGINITIKPGEIHVIMGPNGAGKTSLAMSLMGAPSYLLSTSSVFTIGGKRIADLTPEQRAKKGFFISFQHPIEISGISLLAFLRTSYKQLYPEEKIPLSEFKNQVRQALKTVHLDESFMGRSLNEGFSGGEKKRAEMAQLLVLKPKFVVLDEVDSGLDIDSIKVVAKSVQEMVKRYKTGVIMITHYDRILRHIKPHKVHILVDGKIKKSGTIALVEHVEKGGYAAI